MLFSGFRESVSRSPEALALDFGGEQVTYGELDALACSIARSIANSLEERPSRIAILGEKNAGTYASILACLYLGATYVPLNLKFPLSRTLLMVALAEADLLICDEAGIEKLRQGSAEQLYKVKNIGSLFHSKEGLIGVRVVPLSREQDAISRSFEPVKSTSNAAYIMFTSGSTGIQKGVEIMHEALDSFFLYNMQYYDFATEDRFSQIFDLTFDLSIFDMFMAWNCGACLCPVSPMEVMLKPKRVIDDLGITVWFSVPTLVQSLIQRDLLSPRMFPKLRWSLFCGEPLLLATVERWQKAAPSSQIENLYGPTELTIACSSYRWKGPSSVLECSHGVVPIGNVFPHLEARIVSDETSPKGELVVRGPQMFNGYWKEPAKTAQALYKTAGGDVFYRTGDIVEHTEGIGYSFLGRTDNQVKVQGMRVELGEVEHRLRSQPGVIDAVALLSNDSGITSIVAFLLGSHIDIAQVRSNLAKEMPAQLIPRRIHVRTTFPVNVNGKIDRAALLRDVKSASMG